MVFVATGTDDLTRAHPMLLIEGFSLSNLLFVIIPSLFLESFALDSGVIQSWHSLHCMAHIVEF